MLGLLWHSFRSHIAEIFFPEASCRLFFTICLVRLSLITQHNDYFYTPKTKFEWWAFFTSISIPCSYRSNLRWWLLLKHLYWTLCQWTALKLTFCCIRANKDFCIFRKKIPRVCQNSRLTQVSKVNVVCGFE